MVGFSDIDLILGDISKFLTNEILEKNYVIGHYGHFFLIKNNQTIKNLFLKETNNKMKEVFASNSNFGFDEWDYSYLNVIKKYFPNQVFDIFSFFSDINVQDRYHKFYFKNNPKRTAMQGKQIYSYNNGSLKGHFVLNKKYYETDCLYVHLQKRKMKVKTKNIDSFVIIPNRFVKFKKINEKNINNFNIISFFDYIASIIHLDLKCMSIFLKRCARKIYKILKQH